MMKFLNFSIMCVLFLVSCSTRTPSLIVYTSSVVGDADECAFWIHPKNKNKSVLIGNDKNETGALYVWDLEGRLIAKTATLNEPTGVDVRYGMDVLGKKIDIVICALRSTNELKVFEIDPESRMLIDITSDKKIKTHFDEKTYGVSLYKRLVDNQIFAFVSSKKLDNIHQIKLISNSKGKIEGKLVRSFGKKDQKRYVEGMVVDDELGFLYCSDETQGILKYFANPEKHDDSLILKFATNDGIIGDREGLGLYKMPNVLGYLVLSSQGNSSFKIYERSRNNKFVKTIFPKGVKDTDGIAVTSTKFLPKFPKGIIACHNSLGKNFAIYSWEEFFDNK